MPAPRTESVNRFVYPTRVYRCAYAIAICKRNGIEISPGRLRRIVPCTEPVKPRGDDARTAERQRGCTWRERRCQCAGAHIATFANKVRGPHRVTDKVEIDIACIACLQRERHIVCNHRWRIE